MSLEIDNLSPLSPDLKKLEIIKKATALDMEIVNRTGFKKFTSIVKRQFQSYYFTRAPIWRTLLRSQTSKNRMTPELFCLGSVRSGTTLLSDFIMQHPCVVLPLTKEIGMNDAPISWLLEAQFPTQKEKQAVEQKYKIAKTAYCSPIGPSLLFPLLARNVNPDAKIVVIMRDPVERAFSHWRWDQSIIKKVLNDKLWKDFPQFDELIDLELDASQYKATTGIAAAGVGCGGYLQHSIYLPFLKSIYKHFDKDNIMLINAEKFFKSPAETAREVYKFYELPDYEPADAPSGNAAPSGKLDDATRAKMSEFFAPINKQLYDYIGEDYGWQ